MGTCESRGPLWKLPEASPLSLGKGSGQVVTCLNVLHESSRWMQFGSSKLPFLAPWFPCRLLHTASPCEELLSTMLHENRADPPEHMLSLHPLCCRDCFPGWFTHPGGDPQGTEKQGSGEGSEDRKSQGCLLPSLTGPHSRCRLWACRGGGAAFKALEPIQVTVTFLMSLTFPIL